MAKDYRLKKEVLIRLQQLCPGDRFDSAGEGSNEVYDLELEIEDSLDKERRARRLSGLSKPRWAFYALSEFNVNFKGDGLVTGIAINFPDLLADALLAAKHLKLQPVVRALTPALKSLPADFSRRTISARSRWFESPAGERAASSLERIEEKVYDAEDAIGGFVKVCMELALREPAEFFQIDDPKPSRSPASPKRKKKTRVDRKRRS
jgi:hypothetical protein